MGYIGHALKALHLTMFKVHIFENGFTNFTETLYAYAKFLILTSNLKTST